MEDRVVRAAVHGRRLLLAAAVVVVHARGGGVGSLGPVGPHGVVFDHLLLLFTCCLTIHTQRNADAHGGG